MRHGLLLASIVGLGLGGGVSACGDDSSSPVETDSPGTETAGPGTTADATESSGTPTQTGDDTTASGPSTTAGPTSNSATATETTDPTDPTQTTDPTEGMTTGETGPSDLLLTIDDTASPTRLVKIQRATGESEPVCDLPPTATYETVTFASDGTLFAHNLAQDRIEVIDPCNCGFVVVGPTSVGTLEMTPDDRNGLFGIDPALDAFLSINPDTGLATVIGALGVDVEQAGIAYSSDEQVAFVIDGLLDQLLGIDPATGTAEMLATVTADLGTPGMEVHPADGELYACSGDNLYTVDTVSGQASLIGPMGLVGPCDNLAAPPEAIACLE